MKNFTLTLKVTSICLVLLSSSYIKAESNVPDILEEVACELGDELDAYELACSFTTNNPPSLGAKMNFANSAGDRILDVNVAALSSSSFVVTYRNRDNNWSGISKIGTISGSSISFAGTGHIFHGNLNTTNSISMDVEALDANNFVITYGPNSNGSKGTAILGSVSGNSISYSAPTTYTTSNSFYHKIAPLDNGSFMVAYSNSCCGQVGIAKVGTVSGNSISFANSGAVFNAGGTFGVAADAISPNNAVIGYRMSNDSKAIVASISGSNISFPSAAVSMDPGNNVFRPTLTVLDNSTFVVGYGDGVNNGYDTHGFVRVGSISGTTVSFPSPRQELLNDRLVQDVVVEALNPLQFAVGYFVNTGGNGFAEHARVTTGTVTGTSIGFADTGVQFHTGTGFGIDIANTGSFVMGYTEGVYNDPNQPGVVIHGEEDDSVLPVELSRFTIHKQERSALLRWETASELFNKGFHIQRKTNNSEEWRSIGFVEGQGTSTSIQEYSFIDAVPEKGMNYYRLKQEDFDGSIEYSKVLAAKFEGKALSVKLAPNPIKSGNNVSLILNGEEETSISVFNAEGQLVHQDRLSLVSDTETSHELELSSLPRGIYIVNVETATGFYSQKLVIQ